MTVGHYRNTRMESVPTATLVSEVLFEGTLYGLIGVFQSSPAQCLNGEVGWSELAALLPKLAQVLALPRLAQRLVTAITTKTIDTLTG